MPKIVIFHISKFHKRLLLLFAQLREWPVEKIHEAISITARRLGFESNFRHDKALKQQKYFHGILRRWRGEAS